MATTRAGCPATRSSATRAAGSSTSATGSGADLAVRGNGCVAADFDRDGRTDLYVTDGRATPPCCGTRATARSPRGRGGRRRRRHPAGTPGPRSATSTATAGPTCSWPATSTVNAPIPRRPRGSPTRYLGVRDLLYLSEGRAADGRVTFREVGVEAGLEVGRLRVRPRRPVHRPRRGRRPRPLRRQRHQARTASTTTWPGRAGRGRSRRARVPLRGAGRPGRRRRPERRDGRGRRRLRRRRPRGPVRHQRPRPGPRRCSAARSADLVDPSFVDVRQELGTDLDAVRPGGASSLADLDLDTDLDLVSPTAPSPSTDLDARRRADPAFANLAATASAPFEDVERRRSPRSVRCCARGSAAADFDNDGDLDVAVQRRRRPPRPAGEPARRRATGWRSTLDGFAPGSRGHRRAGGRPHDGPRGCTRAAATCRRRTRALHFGLGDADGGDASSSAGPTARRTTWTTWPPTGSVEVQRAVRRARRRRPQLVGDCSPSGAWRRAARTARRATPTRSRAASRSTAEGGRSPGCGTRRCSTPSAATSRRPPSMPATCSTRRPRCGTPGPPTTPTPTATSSTEKHEARATSEAAARGGDQLRRLPGAPVALLAGRRAPGDVRRAGRDHGVASATGSTSSTPRATRPRRSATGSPPR